MQPDQRQKASIVDFMHAADTGIDDFALTRQLVGAQSMAHTQPSRQIVGQLVMGATGLEAISIKAVHKATDTGEPIPLDMHEESEGTQKLFVAAGAWLKILSEGSVLFVDELNISLHPLILRFLVELFHSRETNPKNSQLVFSTHDTSVLDKDIFRRDQVWFVSRDESQASVLQALSDFSPRKDEAIERNYLKGRYGALPNVGELNANG